GRLGGDPVRQPADLRQALLGDPARRGGAARARSASGAPGRAAAVLRPRDPAHRRARRAPDPHHLGPVAGHAARRVPRLPRLRARGRVVERDAEGRALRVSGTIADIDSRKRAETALQEAEARYRSLVDLAPNGVLVHSAGVIEYANPAAARLLKAESPAQLIGMQLEALFNPADLPRVRERQSVLLAAPAAVGFEERRMRCLDGTELIVE